MAFHNQLGHHTSGNILVHRTLGDAYHIVKTIYDNLNYFLSFPQLYENKVAEFLVEVDSQIQQGVATLSSELAQVYADFTNSIDTSTQDNLDLIENTADAKIQLMCDVAGTNKTTIEGLLVLAQDFVNAAETAHNATINIEANLTNYLDQVTTLSKQTEIYKNDSKECAEESYKYYSLSFLIYGLIERFLGEAQTLIAEIRTYEDYPDQLTNILNNTTQTAQQVTGMFNQINAWVTVVEDAHADILSKFVLIENLKDRVEDVADEVEEARTKVKKYYYSFKNDLKKANQLYDRAETLLTHGTLLHQNTFLKDITFTWDLGTLADPKHVFKNEKYSNVKVVNLTLGTLFTKDLGNLI